MTVYQPNAVHPLQANMAASQRSRHTARTHRRGKSKKRAQRGSSTTHIHNRPPHTRTLVASFSLTSKAVGGGLEDFLSGKSFVVETHKPGRPPETRHRNATHTHTPTDWNRPEGPARRLRVAAAPPPRLLRPPPPPNGLAHDAARGESPGWPRERMTGVAVLQPAGTRPPATFGVPSVNRGR